jgi:cephalosporin hydroxylase
MSTLTPPTAVISRTLTAYRPAFAISRRIRSLPPELDAEAAFAFTLGESAISANQKAPEIVWLLELLAEEPPRVVLEIGTDRGGTLFLWTRVAVSDAFLLSLDVQKMVGRLGPFSPFAIVRKSFRRDKQRIELIDEVDSHDERTLARVRDALGSRAVDFLFIDGDHRYEGVRRDFELYAPLVRPGGIVAFHDISPRTTPDTEGTAAFWAELTQSRETVECVADGSAGYGIGVYRVPR